MSPETSIYCTLLDNETGLPNRFGPRSAEEIAAFLNFYLLFYDQVVIPDGACLYNSELRDLLTNPAHARFGTIDLLRSGSLGWAQRSNALSFAELDRFMKDTRSWDTNSASAIANTDYVSLLDEATSLRAFYDFEVTAQRFSDLVNLTLTDDTLVRSLRIRSGAEVALRMIDKDRTRLPDGFTRRSSLFKAAQSAEDRRIPGVAERMRHLSSVLYHGSAAVGVGLPLAYPAAYRQTLNILHQVELPLESQLSHPSAQISGENVEFNIAVLREMSADILLDVRNSSEFRAYLAALRESAADSDGIRASQRFQHALGQYIEFLQIPLRSIATGSYSKLARAHHQARIARYVSRGGSASIALIGLLPGMAVPAVGLTAVWGFAGWQLSHLLERRIVVDERDVRAGSAGLATINTIQHSKDPPAIQ